MTRPLVRTVLMALGIAVAFVGITLLLSLVPFAKRIEETNGLSHLYVNHAFRFTLQVPFGYQARNESNGVIIVPLPTRDDPNPEPVMQVRVRPTGDGAGVPAGSKIYKHGGKAYVVSLWREIPWPFFDETATSLKFIK